MSVCCALDEKTNTRLKSGRRLCKTDGSGPSLVENEILGVLVAAACSSDRTGEQSVPRRAIEALLQKHANREDLKQVLAAMQGLRVVTIEGRGAPARKGRTDPWGSSIALPYVAMDSELVYFQLGEELGIDAIGVGG